MDHRMLNEILDKAENSVQLARNEIIQLLELDNVLEQEKLFATARRVRHRFFGNKVFLYGFVYFSTFCRNGCSFCYYRNSNGLPKRYRKSKDEIVKSSLKLARSGIHLVDLTMGEDPEFLCNGEQGYSKLCDIVDSVKSATGLPVMISPGVVSQKGLMMLKAAGADFYACYQETHNRDIYKTLRLGQDYDERMNAKSFAKSIGMLIEEGLLSGVGGYSGDIADSFEQMKKLDCDQMRTMTFVPQDGTPLSQTITHGDSLELKTIAVMRLLFPDRLIPGSLDVEGTSGLGERLNAGANIITSLIPPNDGLMGVSQSTLNVDDGKRTVAGIMPFLNDNGLAVASHDEYAAYLDKRKHIGRKAVAN